MDNKITVETCEDEDEHTQIFYVYIPSKDDNASAEVGRYAKITIGVSFVKRSFYEPRSK